MAEADLSCGGCGADLGKEPPLPGGFADWMEAPTELFGCPACLTVSARARGVLIAGARVARFLERLRDADRDAVLAAVEEIRPDPVARLMLRVPAVFGVIRPLFRKAGEMAEPGFFAVTRESRATSRGGSVSVEGFWTPPESELDLLPGSSYAIERYRRFQPTVEEPDLRQPPALLQAWDGEVMLEAGARLAIVGESRCRLHVQPARSAWVAQGRINHLRATLDLLRPGS